MKYTIKIIAIILTLSYVSFSQIFSQNTESTRNPWQMTQQQYELHENTSVSQLNVAPGAHPNYGALPLPEVSYVTGQPDNGAQPSQGQFRFLAAPSHYLKDDPVVFPNQPGASHLHMFFGNTRADAYSEVGTGSQNDLLVRGASTVQGGKGANPSAYWIPALVDGPLNGCDDQRKIILPGAITVYYKTRRLGESQAIPQGLEVIGGNLPQSPGGMVHGMTIQNSSGGDFREGAQWGFYDPAQGQLVQSQSTIPQSNPSGYKLIRAAIGFPQCFASEANGGFVLSSPDHLSHQMMLEDAQGWSQDDESCPSSHPNRIPKIEILVDFRWPDDNDVSGWRLSSDMNAATAAQVPNPGGSLHGDILFAWNEMVQQAWKDECHDPNDPRNCSIGQTGTQWVLDRIENTGTINNMTYTGNPYLSDPYDCGASCPPADTPCDDNDPNTNNDVEDGNCNCAGTCLPAGTFCDDGNPNTTNDAYGSDCICAGTPISTGGDVCPAYQAYPPTGSGIVRNVSNQSQLEAALNAAQPGDVINLATGTYQRVRYHQDSGHANGTATNPIVIQAGDGQSPIINGGGYIGYNGVYVARRNHIIVRGLEVTFAGFGVIFQNVNGGKIEHNVIHDIGYAALAVQAYRSDASLNSSFVEIRCNEIYDTGNYSDEYAEGIYIGSGSGSMVDRTHDILIKGNNIYDISNEPIDVKKYSYNVTIEDNFIHDSTPWYGGAISLGLNKDNWQDGNYLVQRNYIWNISSGRYYAQAIAIGHGTTTIRNNIIWNIETLPISSNFRHVIQVHNSNSPETWAYRFGNPNAKDVYIYNNTIWGCAEDCVSNYTDPNVIIPDVTTRNNLLSSLSGGVVNASTDLLAQANYFEGPITGNADAGTGAGSGFNLLAANAAVDGAVSLNSFNDDILRTARPQGNAWDFGAFERTGTCPPAGTPCNDNNPNTTNDVQDGFCNCAGTPVQNNCDLLTNGNFSNGTTDWRSWNCDINAVAGACQVTNIQQGADAWSAALVQGDFTLEIGKQYEVSFDARSIQTAKNIRAKVGLSEDPWTNYSNNSGQDISLTTNSQTFKIPFTMSYPTTSKARLEFHVGTSTTGLIVDNVELKTVGCTGPCPSAGTACDDGNPNTVNDVEDGFCNCAGTPVQNNCDLITNGDFSEGTTDWYNWNCDIGEVTGACQITNIQQGANAWNAALAQGDFTLENGKQYEVSFDARSIQAAKNIRVKVGLSEDPWTNYSNNSGQDISLTTNSQTFKIPFTMSYPTTSKARLEFHIGTDLTDLVVDNIQLIDLSGDCSDNNNDCEQVQNGNFAGQFTDDWSIQNCEATATNGGIDINVPYVAENPWNIAVKQRGLNYEQGKEYQISFKARANAPRVIYVKAGKSSSPWDTYNYEPIDLTTTLETHTFPFIMEEATDSDAYLEFFLGESDVNLFLGEISVVETACVGLRELSNEMITNYTVFPNPVNDILTVQFDLSDEYNSGTVRLFDLTGRVILEEEKAMFTTNEFQLNIQTIPAGVYMLRMDVGGYFLTHKVVKY